METFEVLLLTPSQDEDTLKNYVVERLSDLGEVTESDYPESYKNPLVVLCFGSEFGEALAGILVESQVQVVGNEYKFFTSVWAHFLEPSDDVGTAPIDALLDAFIREYKEANPDQGGLSFRMVAQDTAFPKWR